MAEKVYGLSQGAFQRVANVVRKVERRLPDVGRRTRRVQSTGRGIELVHGVIIEECNSACSTYRVQRVHRYLKTTCEDCDDGSGSGSGS